MQKTFQKDEIAEVADACLNAIFNGESTDKILIARGSKDPVADWYQVRRWIKSNRPEQYMNIPFQLRREMPERQEVVTLSKVDRPVVTVAAEAIEKPTETLTVEDKHGEHTFKLYGENKAEEKKPEQKAEQDELAGFTPVAKRRGRPPKNEKRVAHKAPATKERVIVPTVVKEEPKVKMKILTASSENFVFKNRTRDIEIARGADVFKFPKAWVKELIEALPVALEMFGEEVEE